MNSEDKILCLEKEKVSWDTYKWTTGIIFSALITIAGFIVNLYIVFYSGLGEMKSDVAVLKTKTEAIEKKLDSVDGSMKSIMGVFKNSKIEMYEDN